MRLNWLLIPTVLLAMLLFGGGQALWRRWPQARRRAPLLAAAIPLAIPCALFALYYLHGFDGAAWFYEFRSWPLSELAASGAGLLAGALAGAIPDRFRIMLRPLLLAGLCLALAVPYVKPLIAPLALERLSDQWRDGVCLQSAWSTCGPSCVATLLKQRGIGTTEEQLARECFTYRGGTEAWHLARALRRRGLRVAFFTAPLPIENLPAPAIAGVKINDMGHFITILERSASSYVIGDPIDGKHVVRKEDVLKAYNFTGFFMAVRP